MACCSGIPSIIPPLPCLDLTHNILQAELRRLAAFKMPEEKVQCITRVSTIIMNLLSLSQDKSVPAADDLMPVLVFVSLNFKPPASGCNCSLLR